MQWLTNIFITFTFFNIVSSSATHVIFPNYLVPAKKETPNTIYGTQYTGDVRFDSTTPSKEIVLYVGFDVPNYADTTNCKIKFTLPTKVSDPNGYPWNVTGTGKISVYGLSSNINKDTLTWNKRPARSSSVALFTITQPLGGGDASVTGPAIPCLLGQRMDFEFSITRPGPASFHWYELTTPKSGTTLEMSS